MLKAIPVNNVLTFPTKKLASYHSEAGHAVVAWLYADCPIDSVTILPGQASIAALARQHLLDGIDFEMADSDEIRRNWGRIQDAIFVSWAGPAAQRRYDPHSKWRRSKEFKKASHLVYRLHQHGHSAVKKTAAYWRYVNVQVDDLLDQFWPFIEALARRLAWDSTISKDDALSVCMRGLAAGSPFGRAWFSRSTPRRRRWYRCGRPSRSTRRATISLIRLRLWPDPKPRRLPWPRPLLLGDDA